MQNKIYKLAYTTDLLIFGIDNKKNKDTRGLSIKSLSILLVKRAKEPFINKWALPGGYINENETCKEASIRVLKKETGLTNVYMTDFVIKDEINRDPRGRTISNSRIALIDRTLLKDNLNEEASWFNIYIKKENDIINLELNNNEEVIEYKVKEKVENIKAQKYSYEIITKSNVAFDHDELIIEGLMYLRRQVESTDIVFNMMPELFTIGELKQVYEIILGHPLINSAFRRTIKDKVIFTDDLIKTGGHRPSLLCKYNYQKKK